MVNRPLLLWVVLFGILHPAAAWAQQAGSIRGMVYDKDFNAPLARAQVLIVQTGQRNTGADGGNYVFAEVAPGEYTLVFSKDGYAQQVVANVVVTAGQLTDVDASLAGEFTEMEELVVQDLQLGAGTEAGLLKLRFESPSLVDSISSELMSRAGASDAAAALRLVAGATVQDGKYAVVRGLPDRYVNSQINGVRLPTADEDKRAVQLDQFPSAAIESIRVSKSFTPDQQGDASGGAVNVILKGIPDEAVFQLRAQIGYNSQVSGRDDFLTYDGGGLTYWGDDHGHRSPQLDLLGLPWEGAAGVSRDDAPLDYKWSVAGGGKHEFDNGVKIGGFASLFYERDSSFYDDGVDDSFWVTEPGLPMTPQTLQGTPEEGSFKTALFDVTQGSRSVQWGALGTLGLESEHHTLGMTYLYTHIAEDTATLAEDTRGKEFFFPGYDPNDLSHPGNQPGSLLAAPFIRAETLDYVERRTETFQLNGKHELPIEEFGVDDVITFKAPELDWILASSTAKMEQPDKRQFGSLFVPASLNPGFPPFVPPFETPQVQLGFQPDVSFTLGFFQRIFKEIQEDSDQYSVNLKLPFSQWSESEGYLKFGWFDDHVKRKFNQDSFSNFNDPAAAFPAPFDQFWSEVFPTQIPGHAISDGPPFVDVDYNATQDIVAGYTMVDLPLASWLNVIGGMRSESTRLSVVNFPEEDATWFPPGAISPIALDPPAPGQPGDADVDFSQHDMLPSFGLVIRPTDQWTIRTSYSETIARQTFKELTPIIQQEYLGGPIFIGNPELRMSSLQNYDLRVDFAPYQGGLVSASVFRKDVIDPIENVQRVGTFTYTTPVNFPEGELTGVELEVRQNMGYFWEELSGLSLGANATFIDSNVTLSEEESAGFDLPEIAAPTSSRDMTNAPEHLLNFYLTYDLEATGTQFGIFYTIRGDMLIAGAGQNDGNFVPDVYETEYDTLNITFSQKLGKHFKLHLQAKNLTNPDIQSVYRSSFIGSDVLKTSSSAGIDLSIGLSAEFTF